MSLAAALVPRSVPGRVGGAFGCRPCEQKRVGAITRSELMMSDCGEPDVLAAALAALGATPEQAEAKLGAKRGQAEFCLGVALARDYHENGGLAPDAALAKAKANVSAELDKLFPSKPGAWRRPVIAGVGLFLTVMAAAHFLDKIP